jgi:hypothetical protein
MLSKIFEQLITVSNTDTYITMYMQKNSYIMPDHKFQDSFVSNSLDN